MEPYIDRHGNQQNQAVPFDPKFFAYLSALLLACIGACAYYPLSYVVVVMLFWPLVTIALLRYDQVSPWIGRGVAIAAILIAVACLSTNDYIVTRDQIERGEATIYRTWREHRWSQYREVSTHTIDESGDWLQSSGQITPSNKRHGRWQSYGCFSGEFLENEQWYWYGDEVSEGEFMRRNK